MSLTNRWCFTLNNPGTWRPLFQEPAMIFLIYQLERGEQGTLHLQGYVRFSSRKRLSTVKNILGRQELHAEPARGSESDNRAYCSKEDTRVEGPWEFGTYNPEVSARQGKRTDLDEVADALKQGKPLEDVALEHSVAFMKYTNGIKALAEMVRDPPAVREVETHVIWGPTGTGKTHYVMTNYEDVFVVCPGRSPWDEYKGETTILFDEFNDAEWPLTTMLKLLDKWKYCCSARYSNKYARWTTIFICSNENPENFYKFASPAQLAAFRRRITSTRYFGVPYAPDNEP